MVHNAGMSRPKKLVPEWFANLDNARIGSGWRVLAVRKTGRKWIFLTALGCGTNFRMLLKDWNDVSKKPIKKIKGKYSAIWDEDGQQDRAR